MQGWQQYSNDVGHGRHGGSGHGGGGYGGSCGSGSGSGSGSGDTVAYNGACKFNGLWWDSPLVANIRCHWMFLNHYSGRGGGAGCGPR